MNLVTNARDAVTGGGRITLSTRIVRGLSGVEAERQVVLAVSDSGPAMSEDIRARGRRQLHPPIDVNYISPSCSSLTRG
ncbi:MAG: hypothetical protein IPG04_16820 [Polyangiaceae bacterium]|nr:hypothetical protein [Polyangiaceae bacterium]